MSVYFHANFNLNSDRLAAILKHLIEQPKLNDEQIAHKFGYKAPFTKRYKSWLKKCGLIKNSTKIELTDYGKIIYKKDPKLEKSITLWYMHSFLASSEENAEAWNYFYHTFLPKNKSFTKSDLSMALSMKLMAHHPSHFGKNAPMIKVITKVLINSYLSEKAFGILHIVDSFEDRLIRKTSKNPFKWDTAEGFENLY